MRQILLVESEVQVCECLRAELLRRGLSLTAAPGAPEARMLLEDPSQSYDLVLAPASPGGALELLALLQAQPGSPDLVVGAAEDERAAGVACLAAGARALVRRPYDLAELFAVIPRALEVRDARALHAQNEALRLLLEAPDAPHLVEAVPVAFLQLFSAASAALLVPNGPEGLVAVKSSVGAPTAPPAAAWIRKWLAAGPSPTLYEPSGLAATQSTVALWPLTSGGRLVGLVQAERRKPPFARSELDRATPLVSHARAALDAADLAQKLASADRLVSLGHLAASIAHEVKSPLTYVLENARYVGEGVAQLERAARDADAEREAARLSGLLLGPGSLLRQLAQSAADTIEGAGRIRDIVRDVGALANADETTRMPLELNEAIRAAVRITQSELRGKANVVTRLGKDTFVVGSAGRLSQVFVNLIVNAAQAIGSEGSRAGQIVVLSRREGSRVIAEVSDNGPGVRKDVLPRLFEPFFTTKSPGEGTGLGLFLCRDILRRHGGEIRVRSTPGRGTTFSLELPLDPSHAQLSSRSEDEARGTGTGTGLHVVRS